MAESKVTTASVQPDVSGATPDGAAEPKKPEEVQTVPIAQLHPFEDHPFKVLDDDAMAEIVDSIKQGGIPPEMVVEKVRFIVTGSQHGYRPKPVRRKEIPKPNGKTRPLGIPCIWDRLIQQCIKQILEPICEAKFSNNSYGFRPNRSVEHAINKTYTMLQRQNAKVALLMTLLAWHKNSEANEQIDRELRRQIEALQEQK